MLASYAMKQMLQECAQACASDLSRLASLLKTPCLLRLLFDSDEYHLLHDLTASRLPSFSCLTERELKYVEVPREIAAKLPADSVESYIFEIRRSDASHVT